ncbi:MAG: polyribonucleotide nucleotidyltransferase [SAR324 cluster bacterium]|nr:polyribonucleotide nucleotidyltransferase [SAR324 cluster bacterium]
MNIIETEFAGTTLSLETGRMAKQTNGSVLVKYGETTVLVTATAEKGNGSQSDFFPLSVHFVQKMYAAGRIPGGFFKREGRLSDQETLTSRFIDRPLRPLFDPAFFAETVVVATVLSYDDQNAPDVAALVGASAALLISDIPYYKPVAGIRVGYVEGNFVANPTSEQLLISELDIFMAGSRDAIIMVEGDAKQVSESLVLDAILFGHAQIQPLIDVQMELAKICGKQKRVIEPKSVDVGLKTTVTEFAIEKIRNALAIKEKQERYAAVDAVVAETLTHVLGESRDDASVKNIKGLIEDLKSQEMRGKILHEQIRIDGRGPRDIRKITCETGVLPRVHGSALFTRGETQALVVTTLGTKEDEQMIDSLSGVTYKNFMLHYNFPGFSVGEAKAPRGPGRREIGHGFLAERGLATSIPPREKFPYTIRLVSEILESNGSSSMATVCGGSLSMMDAGIPISVPTAGIAMGLIKEGDNTVVLSDILGDEDHLGDMDFKVVGTEQGITALQMDIKIEGLDKATISSALEQAREGRLHILGIMNEAIHQPRAGLSSYAPRFVTHKISREQIGSIIGPGGKIIKGIVEKTGAKISVDDDGVVHISSKDHTAVDSALEEVLALTRSVKIGEVYTGPVKRVTDFGLFVEIFTGTEGLVHISNLAEGRVRSASDIAKLGDSVTVKAIGFDKRGKLQLSMKDV